MLEIDNSYFDGGLLQLIGYHILGSVITTLTFGICLPWAYCLIYEWEAKHTVIEGRRLRFDGGSAFWQLDQMVLSYHHHTGHLRFLGTDQTEAVADGSYTFCIMKPERPVCCDRSFPRVEAFRGCCPKRFIP